MDSDFQFTADKESHCTFFIFIWIFCTRYVESIIGNARTLIISFTRHKCNTHPKYELHTPNLFGLNIRDVTNQQQLVCRSV